MSGRLQWERDGAAWPHRRASRFVEAGGLRWHVQQMGAGPALLLVHGTGASTHSWRNVAPFLAERFTVVAPDLPGHAFTDMPPMRDMSLRGMSSLLSRLIEVIGKPILYAAGHSAGAAIAIQLCLDGAIRPRGVASLNGALLPLHGAAGVLFAPLARLMASSAIFSRLFAWRVSSGRAVERLLEGTGSTLDPDGVALYRRLAGNAAHANAALAMMAHWDLHALDLARLDVPLLLVVGKKDRAVPPSQAEQVRRRVKLGTLEWLDDAGHLAHEERPQAVAQMIFRHAAAHGAFA